MCIASYFNRHIPELIYSIEMIGKTALFVLPIVAVQIPDMKME